MRQCLISDRSMTSDRLFTWKAAVCFFDSLPEESYWLLVTADQQTVAEYY